MRIYPDDPMGIRIRWFRANPDALVAPGFSPYRSASTWDQFDELQHLGEQLRARDTVYDKGQNTIGYFGQDFDGSLRAWTEGADRILDPQISTYRDGTTDICRGLSVNPNAPLMTERFGEGYIVAWGTSTLLAYADARTGPVADWNAEMWAFLADFRSRYGNGGILATVGNRTRWATLPVTIDDGGRGGSDRVYGPADMVAFAGWLATVAVLITGYPPGLDAQPADFLSVHLAEVVDAWIAAGGVLWIVSTPETELVGYESNILLEKIGAATRFSDRLIGMNPPGWIPCAIAFADPLDQTTDGIHNFVNWRDQPVIAGTDLSNVLTDTSDWIGPAVQPVTFPIRPTAYSSVRLWFVAGIFASFSPQSLRVRLKMAGDGSRHISVSVGSLATPVDVHSAVPQWYEIILPFLDPAIDNTGSYLRLTINASDTAAFVGSLKMYYATCEGYGSLTPFDPGPARSEVNQGDELLAACRQEGLCSVKHWKSRAIDLATWAAGFSGPWQVIPCPEPVAIAAGLAGKQVYGYKQAGKVGLLVAAAGVQPDSEGIITDAGELIITDAGDVLIHD